MLTQSHSGLSLAKYCVELINIVSPMASLDRDNGELGQDDDPENGSGYFLGALYTLTT